MLTKKKEPSKPKAKATKTVTKEAEANKKAVVQKKDYLPSKKEMGKTCISVTYDAGFGNALHIRGNGAGLRWDSGAPLQNIGSDQWIWETDAPFSTFEFKILINDSHYETGENRHAGYGTKVSCRPNF